MPSEVSIGGADQDLGRKVEELERELTEAREQQSATAQILAVVLGSATDVQPVFDAIASSAARLCDALDAVVMRVDGDGDILRLVAHHGPMLTTGDVPLHRGTVGGRAIIERRLIHVADLQAEGVEFPEGSAIARRLGHRTTLSIPLLREGAAVGNIQVRRDEVRLFTDKQIALLRTFADQAVVAIENARLFTELKESLEYQTATSDVLSIISRSPSQVQPVLDAIVENAGRLCHAEYAFVYKLENDKFQLVASNNAEAEHARYIAGNPPNLDRGSVAGRAALDRATVHLVDARADPQYTRTDSQRLGRYRSLLGVPLLRDGVPIGVLVLLRTEVAPFTDKQIDLVTAFANQAVIATHNAGLFQEVQTRTRELNQSLEYQTATGEVLNIISRSPTQLQPVLDTIVETAARLCLAEYALIFRLDSGMYHLVAAAQAGQEVREFLGKEPRRADRGSVIGRVALEGRTIHVPDVLADAEYSRWDSQRIGGFRTMLGVPLVREGALLGAILLIRKTVKPFSSKQIEVVTTFAAQAVIAIENTRLFEAEQASKRELQESLEYQTAIGEVLNVISRSPSQLQPVFDFIARSASRLCGDQHAIVTRYDGNLLHLAAQHNPRPGVSEEQARFYPRVPHAETSISGRAFVQATLVHIPDVENERWEPSAHEGYRRMGLRAAVAVPMIHDARPIGVIGVSRGTPGTFSDRQIELLRTFADQAVIAIENTRLFEEVQARTRELQESLEYQTATSEVLAVISRSPNDLQPVLDTIAETAGRLCEADYSLVFKLVDGLYGLAASSKADPASAQWLNEHPLAPTRGSVLGRTAIEQRTIHLPDALADPEFNTLDRQRVTQARTALGVPLVRDGISIGVIVLVCKVVRPFTNKQIELVETFANQAMIAIENTRLFEAEQASKRELRESLEYQTATSDVLNVISRSPTDVQPVFEVIAESAVRLCGANYGSTMRLDGDVMHLVAHKGQSAHWLETASRLFPHQLTRGLIAGWAILDGEIVHVEDMQNDARFPTSRSLARTMGYRTVLCVPMLRGSVPTGAILVFRQEARPFSEAEIGLLQTFADQAVIAIENTRLFEEVQARNRDLTALGEVGRAVGSTLDLKVVLRTIVERAVHLSGTDAGSMFYYRAEVDRFELGETTGLDEEIVARFRKLDISAREGGLGEAIAKRQPLQIPDLSQRPRELLRDAVLEAGFRASLIVPLLGGEGPVGALVLRRRQPGEFSATVVSLMQAFADQSAIALENARLFEEIAQKSRELEIASQHKSQFVANMSHELRTPLAAILGYAELMQEGFYGAPPEKSMDALTRIRSNGKHLLGLINTVLDIAKIESGQFSLNLGEYALETVVETVRAATESLAETKKLALKTDVAKSMPFGLGDEQRLTQVLLNLVGNAIKFTDNGEVRITATAMNGHFTVAVTDTGPGIPQGELNRVFDQFHQVDSSNTKAKGGTGLGLAISKQIVDMHGGRIWVESTLGQGATFQMQLPIRAESPKAPA